MFEKITYSLNSTIIQKYTYIPGLPVPCHGDQVTLAPSNDQLSTVDRTGRVHSVAYNLERKTIIVYLT